MSPGALFFYGARVIVDVDINPTQVFNASSHCLYCRFRDRLNCTRNHASIAGGAIFAREIRDAKHFMERCRNVGEEPLEENTVTTSYAENPVCLVDADNTVGEGGYGPDVATTAIGFFAALIYDNGTRVILEEGAEYDFGDWKSGDDFPTMQISLHDDYGQGPARKGSSSVNLPHADLGNVHLPDYSAPVTAVLRSADGLLPNDIVADLASGEANLTIGSPMVKPEIYTATLSVPDLSTESIRFRVRIRPCIVNEVPREDNRGCNECDPGQYNFDPRKGRCVTCPDDADCLGKYILPESEHWNAFPCSHHVQKCISTEACLGRNSEALNTTSLEDKATGCELSEKDVRDYQLALCKEGYEGSLCGSCARDHGRFGTFRCLPCQHPISAIATVIAALFFMTILSLIQIRGTLTLADLQSSRRNFSRLIKRWKRLSVHHNTNTNQRVTDTPQQEAGPSDPTARPRDSSSDYQSKAQEENIKFVQILKVTCHFLQGSLCCISYVQIAVNFVQVVAAGMALDIAWSSSVLRLFEAWGA